MKQMKLLHIILITLAILFAADIAMKIINSRLGDERPTETQTQPTVSERKEEKPLADFEPIAKSRIFQRETPSETESAPPTAEPTENLEVTNLKLTLKGTVVATTKERSFAIIEDEKLRMQNLYHIDDTISNGITLSAVYTDRAVINRDGQKELLLMFTGDSKKSTSKGSTARATTPPRRSIPRQEIKEAVSDIRSVMRDVRIIPHFTAGKRDGFTVTYVRQGSRLEEFGLQKNDIIKEINGAPAEDFRNIFEIFNKYADASTLDLGVERDNQVITISYTIE
jgi:general secretion pathway protein C